MLTIARVCRNIAVIAATFAAILPFPKSRRRITRADRPESETISTRAATVTIRTIAAIAIRIIARSRAAATTAARPARAHGSDVFFRSAATLSPREARRIIRIIVLDTIGTIGTIPPRDARPARVIPATRSVYAGHRAAAAWSHGVIEWIGNAAARHRLVNRKSAARSDRRRIRPQFVRSALAQRPHRSSMQVPGLIARHYVRSS
jgi:hypothetical protein